MEDRGGASAPEKPGTYAVLKTSLGDVRVRLLSDEAPRAVENFIALARGGKEWTDPATGKKTSRPLYDGTRFFRVIPGFLIQGGDPTSKGSGGPGYAFADELFPGRGFNRPGLMAMANSGPDTNGSQFFITLTAAPWLDGRHTILGEVTSGLDVVGAIAGVPRTEADPKTGRLIDRPLDPPILRSVAIEEKR